MAGTGTEQAGWKGSETGFPRRCDPYKELRFDPQKVKRKGMKWKYTRH